MKPRSGEFGNYMREVYGPSQIVLITCRGVQTVLGRNYEVDDILPITQHTLVGQKPQTYAIVVNKKLIGCKFIDKSKTFVVNFMNFLDKEKIILAGKHHGEFHDKFKEIEFTKENCEKILDCSRIKEAVAVLECEVINKIDTGDSIMFVGNVLHHYVKKKVKRPFLDIDNNMTTTK